ncbi:MAG TPA: ATP-binding protein [Usitatibacter sp.]|nr:ATP-binding protein [Usitatibacter sp.]
MSPGITLKLFIAVLVTNIITAVAVGLGVRTAFTSGFESYIQEREEQRLTRLSTAIANAYRDKGNWDFLQGSDEAWLQLNRESRPDIRRRRPPGPEGFDSGPGGSNPRGSATREGGFPRPPPAVVLDMRGNVVVGDGVIGGNGKTRPIIVDGQQVGWLSVPVRRPPFEFADRRFQEDQLRAGWIVALCAIAISAVVAWFVARGMLTPVKRLAAATRRLAEGEYSTRVASTSNDEIGRLVDDFNRLGNTLEKNEALRRNFMADASHELRTPIAVLKAELEAIQDGVRAPTPENIKSLQTEVERLGKLVADLHELSLADVGGLAYHFEDLDLAQLVREALDGARERLAARDLELETKIPNTPVRVRADPQRLFQLIANLVENSARYTDPGGKVRVTLGRDARHAHLDWEDSAPGVPAEALGRIFERLYRVEGSRSRDRGGSGLGLAICQSIAQAHGGTIEAHASKLGGLWIELRLPNAKAGES